MLAAAPSPIAMFSLLRSRLIADVLRIGGELGMTYRRRRIAESQVHVDPPQACRIGLAGAPDDYDVRSRLEQGPMGYLYGGIGNRGQDVGALVDGLGIVADLYLDIVLGRHLTAETLAVFPGGTEHLQLLDVTHAGEGLHMGARHAA